MIPLMIPLETLLNLRFSDIFRGIQSEHCEEMSYYVELSIEYVESLTHFSSMFHFCSIRAELS